MHAVPNPARPDPAHALRLPAAARRRAQRSRTHREILDATERLLLADGVEGFSIRKLVAACGYSAPTVYQHFGDRDGLLAELAEARFALLERRLRRLPREVDPAEALRTMAHAFIRFGLRYPAHYRLLLELRADDAPPLRSEEGVREQMEQAWRDLWEAGRLRAGDAASAGQALWATCHGIVSGRVAFPTGPGRRRSWTMPWTPCCGA